MNNRAIVLRNPDQATIALIVSWLGQTSANSQEAEGDFSNEYETAQQQPQVSLGGAATSTPAQRHVFWRTRQVQQYLSSREVLARYQEIERDLRQRESGQQQEEEPEIMIEPTENNLADNTSWYLDSRSNSLQDGSRTDSEVYSRSVSNATSEASSDSVPQSETPAAPESPQTEQPKPQQESSPLDNPMLRAFILDLNEAEMTPMLHLVSNMMIPMYFNDSEAEVVRHFLLHKVESTISAIQHRMDLLGVVHEEPEEETLEETEEDAETLLEEQETTIDSQEATEYSTVFLDSEDSTIKPPVIYEVPMECGAEQQEELQVESVGENEDFTEASMQLVRQMMELKTNKQRRTLLKKSRPLVSEKQLAMLEFFEQSLRTPEGSWWNCCQ